MENFLPPSLSKIPAGNSGKVLNIIIAVIIILLIVTIIIFGVLFLRQKLSGGAVGREDLAVKQQQELAALDNTLDELRATDADLDGLSDEEEKKLGTDLNKADTDGDGILDGDEVKIWKTDPLNPDTDGDGFKDGYEVRRGYDPLKKEK